MSVYAFGPFILDTAGRRLTRDGQRLAVPGKAWQILLMLAEAGGRLVLHDAFRARLWPNVVVEDRTLTVHMSTLRKALGGGSANLIETVSREGYRLAASVRVLPEAGPQAAGAPPIATAKTLAVRPFATPDLAPADSYLGVGIADAVTTALGGVPGVTISPVEAVENLAGARSLGVEHLLEGSVQRSAERLRVEVRLIEVASGRTEWSERFEQAPMDPSALQDAIAARVATSLPQSSPADHDVQSYRPRAAEAYFLQLEARAHLKPFTRLPLIKALTLFEQALVLDPDYAMAHAGLASTYLLNSSSVEALGTFGQFLSAMGRHDEAIDAMEQAQRLDPRSVETLQHLAIVYWMAGHAERALEAVGDSLKVLPASTRAHYGRMMILDQLGRRDEAMAERLTTLRGLSVAEGLAEHVEALARSKGWREAMIVWIGLLERTNRWEGAAQQWMAVGEPGRALDALEHCVKARTTYLCFVAQNPCFRPLHGDPRFEQIVRMLKLDGRSGAAVRG